MRGSHRVDDVTPFSLRRPSPSTWLPTTFQSHLHVVQGIFVISTKRSKRVPRERRAHTETGVRILSLDPLSPILREEHIGGQRSLRRASVLLAFGRLHGLFGLLQTMLARRTERPMSRGKYTLVDLVVSFGICGHDGCESARRWTRPRRGYRSRNAMRNELTRLSDTILVCVTGICPLSEERRRRRSGRRGRCGRRRRSEERRADILSKVWKARGCVDGWGRGNRRWDTVWAVGLQGRRLVQPGRGRTRSLPPNPQPK